MQDGEEKKTRWRGRHFGLTYAQANDLDINALEELLKSRNATEWRFYREEHKDGNWHYHGWVYKRSGFDFTSPRYFDVAGFHPSIELVRHLIKWKKYISKGGTLVSTYPRGDSSIGSGDEPSAITLAANGELERAIDVVRRDPRFLIHGIQMERNLRALVPRRRLEPRYRTEQFKPAFVTWFRELHERSQCIILAGPSGIGKTQFIRALYPEYERITNFRNLRGRQFVDGVLFDDVSIRNFELDDMIHLFDVEEDSELPTLYGTFTLMRDCPRIFLTNNTNIEAYTGIPLVPPQITRRVDFKFIVDELF